VRSRVLFTSINPTSETIFIYNAVITPERLATLINHFSFALGGAIAQSFLVFALTFPDKKKIPGLVPVLAILFVLATYLLYTNPYVIGDAYYIGGMQGWAWQQGILIGLYDIYFFAPWLIGLYAIATRIDQVSSEHQKKHLTFLFYSLVIGVLPSGIFTMILPRYGIFEFDWISSLTHILWPTAIAYSIIRHNQMNVHTVYTELLIFACILLLFISIFI
jgi:hypothetical protein